MERFRRIVDRSLELVVITVMGALVVDVLWQVFTRFVLSDPSSYTEELARYLLIWVGLLGGAYAAGRNLHLALDLLPAKLTGRSSRILQIVIEICVMAFAVAVLVAGGIRLVWVTFRLGQTSPALGVELGYVYLVVPVSGVLIAFYSLYRIVGFLRPSNEHPATGASTEGEHGVA